MDENKFHHRLDTLLSALKKRHKITAKQFAESVGLNEKTLSSYRKENGNIPPATTLVAIAQKMNVSTDYLLGLVDDATTDKDKQAVYLQTGLTSASQNALKSIFKDFDPDDIDSLFAPAVVMRPNYYERFNSKATVNAILCNSAFPALIKELNNYFARYAFFRGVAAIPQWRTIGAQLKDKADLVQKENAVSYFQINELFKNMIVDIAQQYLMISGLTEIETWDKYLAHPYTSAEEDEEWFASAEMEEPEEEPWYGEF